MAPPRLIRTLSLTATLVAASFTAPSPAVANGRFPNANLVVVGPGARSDVMLLQLTFGLAISRDQGRSWRWICEDSFAMPSGWDPPLAIGEDGTAILAMLDGMRTSPTTCAWGHPTGDPNLPTLDLAHDATGRTVVAGVGTPGDPNGVYVSSDSGHTWTRGGFIDDLFLDTVEVAPSTPSRVYVTGKIRGTMAALYRSDDGGMRFREMTRDFTGGSDAYLAAVDPTDPDVVYVRSFLGLETFLLKSTDGGARFTRIGSTPDRMTGFALSDDGQTVWIGANDPTIGIQRSERGGPFTRVRGSIPVRCMRYHAGVLYVCANESTEGYALGCSSDGGDRIAPLFAMRAISGVALCPAGTPAHDRCEPLWTAQRAALLGALDASTDVAFVTHADASPDLFDAPDAPHTPDAPAPIDVFDAGLQLDVRVEDLPSLMDLPVERAPVTDAPAPRDAVKAPVDAPRDVPAPQDVASRTPPPSDCGCRAGSAGARPSWLVGLALVLAAFRRRRRA
jgi:MYXO-CTERM domain-containing protein